MENLAALHQLGIERVCEFYGQRAYGVCRHLLNQGLKVFPESDAYLGLLGMVEAAEGEPQKAVQFFEKAIAINPAGAPHFNNLGLALEQLGKTDETIANFLKSIAVDSKYGPAYSNLATTYRGQGKFDLALDYLTKALAFDDSLDYAWFNKGNILGELGRTEEALYCQKQALDLKPDSPEYAFNYGCSLLLLGRWREAWKHHENRHLIYLPYCHKRNVLLHTVGPEWRGEDVKGKRVYLYCTQGEGDKLQFIQFARLNGRRNGPFDTRIRLAWLDLTLDEGERADISVITASTVDNARAMGASWSEPNPRISMLLATLHAVAKPALKFKRIDLFGRKLPLRCVQDAFDVSQVVRAMNPSRKELLVAS